MGLVPATVQGGLEAGRQQLQHLLQVRGLFITARQKGVSRVRLEPVTTPLTLPQGSLAPSISNLTNCQCSVSQV